MESLSVDGGKPIWGLLCANCGAYIVRHYALTAGRCPNCKASLTAGASVNAGK
jgi:hypothetical protein